MSKTSYIDEFEANLRSHIATQPTSDQETPKAPESSEETLSGKPVGMRQRVVIQRPLDALAAVLATTAILIVLILQGISLPARLLLVFAAEMALLGSRGIIPFSPSRLWSRLLIAIGWIMLLAIAGLLVMLGVQTVTPDVQAVLTGDADAMSLLALVVGELVVMGIPLVLGHKALITLFNVSFRHTTVLRSTGRSQIIFGLAILVLLTASQAIVAAILSRQTTDASFSVADPNNAWVNQLTYLTLLSLTCAGLLLVHLTLWDALQVRDGVQARTWEWVVETIAFLVLVLVSLHTLSRPLLSVIPVVLIVVAALLQRRQVHNQHLVHIVAVLAFILVIAPIPIWYAGFMCLLWLPAVLTRQARLIGATEILLFLLLVLITQYYYLSLDPRVVFAFVVVTFVLATAQGVLLISLQAQAGGDSANQRNTPATIAVVVAFCLLTLVVLTGAGFLTFTGITSSFVTGPARSIFLLLDVLLLILEFTLVVLAISAFRRLIRRGRTRHDTRETQVAPLAVNSLHTQQQRLSTLTAWLTEDPALRNLVDRAIGQQVASFERRQRTFSAILGIASLIIGWLLSLFATGDTLAHIGQSLFH